MPGDNIVSLMVRTETMQGLDGAGPVLEDCLQQFEAPEFVGLQQQFLEWFYSVLERQGEDCTVLKDRETAQRMAKEGKVRTFLDARIQEANSKLKAEGYQEGYQEGFQKGYQEGLEEVRREGLEKGLEQVRELLQLLAERRFGAATAERLAAHLAEVREYDRLMAIGGWLVDCASGAELLDRVERRA